MVYDIGANVGYYTLAAAKYARHVCAFEPSPTIVSILRRHVQINGLHNCTIVEKAVSVKSAYARFTPAETHGGENNGTGHLSGDGALVVPTISIDEFCKTQSPPSVMKIDVEGAELQVLEGSASTLAAQRPILFVATHSDELLVRCWQFLESHGYKVSNGEGDRAPGLNEILAMPERSSA